MADTRFQTQVRNQSRAEIDQGLRDEQGHHHDASEDRRLHHDHHGLLEVVGISRNS